MINKNEAIKQSSIEDFPKSLETNEQKYDKQEKLSEIYKSEISKLPEADRLKIQEKIEVLNQLEIKAKDIKFEKDFRKTYIQDFENLS